MTSQLLEDIKRSSLPQTIIDMRFIRRAGKLLFLASLALVVIFIYRNWSVIKHLPSVPAVIIAMAGMCYFAAHLGSALGWTYGLRAIGHPISISAGIKINMASQLGKYLPGNVAHHIARVALGSKVGAGFAGGAIATALEIIGNLIAASIIAAAAIMYDYRPVNAVHQTLSDNIALPALFVLTALALIGLFLVWVKAPLRALLVVSVWLAMGLTMYGASFYIISSSIADNFVSPVSAIGIFVVAWTMGYVIPGAPAGLGVRDVILITWLGSIVGSEMAFICVFFHRLTTSGFDVLIGLSGYGFLRFSKMS